MQIEKEAQLFAEQNATFREVGDNIVQGITSAIGARLAVIEAAAAVGGAAKGFIPNFAGGNLSPKEAAGLLRAGAREKRAMPGGAGLAVANTSEAIIPMRARGFIPNFANGSSSSIKTARPNRLKSSTVVCQRESLPRWRKITSRLRSLKRGRLRRSELSRSAGIVGA